MRDAEKEEDCLRKALDRTLDQNVNVRPLPTALRMAALRSIKPKKSFYKVQAHPVRSNLLSNVLVEDQNVNVHNKAENSPMLTKPLLICRPTMPQSLAPLEIINPQVFHQHLLPSVQL
jgi:hypothetical protein